MTNCSHFSSQNLGIEVRLTTNKGKALFATKSFPVDTLVLREPPAAAIQHTYNKQIAQVCAQCFRFIGSLEDHAARLLFHCSNAGSSVDESDGDGNKGPSSPSPPIIDPDTLVSLATKELKLPYTDTLNLTTHIVPCPHHHCCEEMYCSVDCLEKARTSHHSLLCPGNNKNPDSMKAFNRHADDSNDIFRLAAQVVSQIAQSALAIEEDTDQLHDSHNINTTRLHTAWKQSPYYYGWKGAWWDCVALPDDVDDEDSFRKDLKDLAMESLDLLKHALSSSSGRRTKWGNIPLLFPALFTIDVWGNIIGMFELNNLAIHVPNPLQKWLRIYYENDDDGIMMKAIAEAVESALEESNCDGNAFYSLQSCANHSCTPNMHAFKREDETNGDAVLLALSDIEVGEELTISYIEEELPLEERTMLLKDYGFTCTCSKCCIDRAAAAGEEDGE